MITVRVKLMDMFSYCNMIVTKDVTEKYLQQMQIAKEKKLITRHFDKKTQIAHDWRIEEIKILESC